MKKSPHIIFIIIAAAMILMFTIISLKRESDVSSPGVKPPREKPTPAPTSVAPSPTPGEVISPEDKKTPISPVAAFQINVKVSNQSRQPIKDASVELYPERHVMIPAPIERLAIARTNDKGEATLRRNLSGNFILKVAADTFSSELRKVSLDVGDSAKHFNIVMKAENIISGVVKNQKGEALPNVQVGPLLWEPDADSSPPVFPEFTKTDQKGAFKFAGLKESIYRLQVAHPGYKAVVLDQIQASFENLEITLNPGGSAAKGVTAGSRDGLPCSDVGLLLMGNGLALYALSDEKGSFIFENLEQGQYYLEPVLNDRKVGKPVSLSCDGFASVEDILVKVNQGIILSGTVKDALAGKPLQGVILEIKDRQKSLTVSSDDGGRFLFPLYIPEGGIDIYIASPEFFAVDEYGSFQKTSPVEGYMPDSDIDNISISLEKEYALTGFVEDMNKEERGKYRVKIEPLESESKRKTILLKLGDDLKFATKYMGGGNNAASLVAQKGELAGQPLQFTLDPHTETPLLLLKPSQPNTIIGRVLQHDGNPLEQSSVAAQGIVSVHKASTDNAGTFSFETYEKRLSFEVSSSRYSQTLKRDIDLPVNEEIVFRFSLGRILSGSVVTFDETPVGFASLSYYWVNPNTGENVHKKITADKDGLFSVTDVISDYLTRLICEGPSTGAAGLSKFGRVVFEDLDLPQEDFKIILPRAVNLTIRFVDEQDNPYSGNLSLEAQVWKPDKNIFEMERRETKNVREGVCVISSMNPGIYVFHAQTFDERTGSSDSFELTESDQDPETTIQLHTAEKIYGYVYDRETNSSLQGVNVIFKTSGESQVQHGTTTNSEGYFEMKGLLDGAVRMQFGKNGYVTTQEEVSISRGKLDVSLPLSVYMEMAQASLRGVIYNPQKNPEPSVSLTIRSLKADEEILAISRTGVTDKDGQFFFDKLDQGEYLLNADKDRASASAVVSIASQEKKEISLTMIAKVQVKGSLETKQTILYEQPLLFINRETQRSHLARLSPDRKFDIYLSPGKYRIHIGDSEISAEIFVPEDADIYELDLSF